MQLYRHLTANHVTLKDMPFSREIAMEAYLIENPDILALDDDELSTVQIVEAELPVPGGRRRKNGDGRIDLLAIYGESTAGVIELKLGEVNERHLLQLEDYLSRRHELRNTIKKYVENTDCRFLGVLVGTSITSDIRAKIERGYVVNRTVPMAALIVGRYKGDDNNVYIATETIFRNISRKFDNTKYEFNGNIYGKGRLVLACIKRYVELYPQVTISDLQEAFPSELQRPGPRAYGCFDTAENAQRVLDEGRGKRFFLKPEELIELHGQRIAVCNQWGIGNISGFIKRARKLGFTIKEIRKGKA